MPRDLPLFVVRGHFGQGTGSDMTSLDARGRARTLVPDVGAAVRIGSFDALGHVFAVSSDDEALGLLVDQAFAALAVGTETDRRYRVRNRNGHFDLRWLDEPVVERTDRPGVLAWLQWDVNRRAVQAADADLVLHAGCVALRRRAVVISGRSGCGKSTLVAALAGAGLEYLTDEAVPVDLTTGQVRVYPRPMALDDHSLVLLPEIEPLRCSQVADSYKRVVAPLPGSVCSERVPLDVALVLFPERGVSAPTVLEPISTGDAIVRLAENSFNFPRHGRDAIDALALLVQGAPSYRVVGDDLRTTVSAVSVALEHTVMRPGQYRRNVS